MKLFRPNNISRLLTDGINHFPIQDFEEIEPGCFESEKYKFKTSLYESVKNSIFFSEGTLFYAFAHWSCTVVVPITVGNIERISLDIPPGFSVFCVPLPTAVMALSPQSTSFLIFSKFTKILC